MTASVRGWLFTCTVISMTILSFLCCEAFLLADTCLASAPCTCSISASYAYIYCDNKHLNVMPQFVRSASHVRTVDLYLFSNNLNTVPDYAFKNLSSINATSIQILLGNNKMSSIGRYAFSGIESIIDYVDLSENNLLSIPIAVGNLRGLKELHIHYNDLTSLGLSVQSRIGHTLQYLQIDLKGFSAWPTEFRFLYALKSLYIRYMNFPYIHSGAFQSFENSLTTLSIQHANSFDKIPNAVCLLSNLQSLTLNYFSNLSENSSSIFDHCSKKLNKVTSLNMQFNQLTKFPDAFHIFPSLTALHLSRNSIDIIETEKIPTNNSLSSISFNSNKFKRIPTALSRLKQLTILSLQDNDISSVEDNDLNRLTNLQSLYLHYNPIKYISSHAFRNNVKLTTLDLDHTYLKNIPAAIMSLPKLYSLYIRSTHDPIPCTCDMSYLKGWNASAVADFSGQCAFSNIQIKDFIITSLPHCP